jgi:hypothetical protein
VFSVASFFSLLVDLYSFIFEQKTKPNQFCSTIGRTLDAPFPFPIQFTLIDVRYDCSFNDEGIFVFMLWGVIISKMQRQGIKLNLY